MKCKLSSFKEKSKDKNLSLPNYRKNTSKRPNTAYFCQYSGKHHQGLPGLCALKNSASTQQRITTHPPLRPHIFAQLSHQPVQQTLR
jgi:hypothetical protein